MTTDAESGDVDPMQDAEAWQELSREEQSDILDEGVQDLRGEGDGGAWRHLSDDEKAETIAAVEGDGARELSETEQAMQNALGQTWTAKIFQDLEDVPTVPFECRELSAPEQSLLMEAGEALLQTEALLDDLQERNAEDLDEEELEAVDIETEHFDSAAEVNEWIPKFLGDVTADPAFDAERFRTGREMRPNTRRLLFIEIFLRYQEEAEKAIKFRQE